jgi:hypothetical protein
MLIFLAMQATELIRWHRRSHDEEVLSGNIFDEAMPTIGVEN